MVFFIDQIHPFDSNGEEKMIFLPVFSSTFVRERKRKGERKKGKEKRKKRKKEEISRKCLEWKRNTLVEGMSF